MKRLACLALAAALLLGAAGCAMLFEREEYLEEAYEVPQENTETDEGATDAIENYTALRRAIVRLVAEHAESAQLQFQNYDGTIQQDISTACWEVKSSTALGAFAVDYISYDLSRIVSYYQAEIYITYKRAAYQVEAVEPVAGPSGLAARLDDALRAGETYLALECSSAAVTADAVREDVLRSYTADPLACPVLPGVEIGVFPENGVNRILEIALDYGMDGETLSQRRSELSAALEELMETLPAEDGAAPYERLNALCAALAERCAPDPAAGATVWDALTQGAADSEGFAMAFCAGCRALEIECVPVSGRLDGEPHHWAIVTLDGASYHVDAAASGEEAVFLLDDEAMLSGGYWWDPSAYPACPAPYDPAAGEATDEPSGEAQSTEEREEEP